MSEDFMLKTKFDGEEITHRLLWSIAKEQAAEAQKRTEGWLNPAVVARVFAFHTIEAHLNYVGERIAPEIWANERNSFRKEPYRGVLGKLRKIMDLVDMEWTPEARPLKTVLALKEIRDVIAHGKAEKLRGEEIHQPDTDAPYPVSQLRQLSAPRDALTVILADVEEFLDAIQKKAKPLLKVTDVWFRDKALQGPCWYTSRSTTRSEPVD